MIVNKPYTINSDYAIYRTNEDVAHIDFHDNNIVFILNVVKANSPCIVSVSFNRDNLISNILSVSGQFEPYLLIINIDLLNFERITMAKIDIFTGFQNARFITINNQTGKLISMQIQDVSFSGEQRNIFIS
ncbi:hypothetical protein SDC9_121061 [bioreactor metagenome]|uniref:Uncharacterized protein n=1 Tax=bioreactor metagenome TaxID=1076179 RepID=A0A645CAW0_9ZZZZ